MSEATATTDADQTIPFHFKGNGSEYFKIWIVNLCLTIITLGIYSAWAKVRRNRYFYGNTSLDGNSFDYLANPVSILKGRLIAFACFSLYTFLPNFMAWAKVGPIKVFIAQGALFIALMIALPWFIVRSLTFRARNTAYRNIRLNFKGSYLDALLNYALLPIVFVMATFGLTYLAMQDRAFATQLGAYILIMMAIMMVIYPYFLFRQKRMVVTGSKFGTSPFGFAVTTGAYYKAFGLLLLASIGLVLLLAILSGLVGAAFYVLGVKLTGSPFLYVVIGYLIAIVFYTFLFAFYNAYVGNITVNGIGIDGHKLQSDLSVFRLLWIYATNLLGIIFTLGLYIPWAMVRTVKYRADHVRLQPAGPLDQFVSAQQSRIGAAGEELGEMFDFDISL